MPPLFDLMSVAVPLGPMADILWDKIPPLSLIIVVSGALALPGTSSARPGQLWEHHTCIKTTSSGLSDGDDPRLHSDATARPSQANTGKAITELRRLSGLTWDQLGQLFEVSRRSVFFWASGKPLSAPHEERLLCVLDIVRAADRGDAQRNRAMLFEARDGQTPFDLLTSQHFDDARTRLGPGPGRRPTPSRPLDATGRAARQPLPPATLVDARHDRVHRDIGRAIAVRTVRDTRREGD